MGKQSRGEKVGIGDSSSFASLFRGVERQSFPSDPLFVVGGMGVVGHHGVQLFAGSEMGREGHRDGGATDPLEGLSELERGLVLMERVVEDTTHDFEMEDNDPRCVGFDNQSIHRTHFGFRTHKGGIKQQTRLMGLVSQQPHEGGRELVLLEEGIFGGFPSTGGFGGPTMGVQ